MSRTLTRVSWCLGTQRIYFWYCYLKKRFRFDIEGTVSQWPVNTVWCRSMSCGDLQHTSSSSVVSCQFYVVYVNNEWIVVKQLWQISATMLTRHNNAHCSVAGLQILATKILKSDNILYLLPGSSVWSVLKRHWHKNFGLAFFCRNKLLEHVSHNTALCLAQHVTDNNYSLFITNQSQFRFRRAPRMTSYWVQLPPYAVW